MDLVLPLYSLGMVVIHYRPQVLAPTLGGTPMHDILWWAVWIVIGALGGLLALSALLLAFCLVYSPVYLIANASRLLDPHVWADRREVRFYLGCLAILCGLLVLAFLNPEAALVAFILLAGFGQALWRVLV